MKILYITTISNTINAFLIPHIKMLIKQGYIVDVACNVVRPINAELLDLGCKVHNIPFQRKPLSKDNVKSYSLLKSIIETEKYDAIHTHTPNASVISRLACKKMKHVKVIYTAHGFHFYKGAPIKNWLLYYPVEKFLSRYSDMLITINKEDYKRAKSKFQTKLVEYIPGVGFETRNYISEKVDFTSKRKELKVPNNAFMILSVGELNSNKNHETIIKAIAKLNNSNIYYVICGQGTLEEYLKKLAIELGVFDQIRIPGFRTDISEICSVADIFAFPSKREGLGLAALEAMASGLPLITSNIHGIVDYSIDNITGFNSAPSNIGSFAQGIERLYKNDKLRKQMSDNNRQSVKMYDIANVKQELMQIYKKIL